MRDGFVAVDPASGRIERVADVEADRPSARMNDGKVDPQGRFWAGTTDIDHRPGLGTLYRLDGKDHLWVALWDGWAVERNAPDGNVELRVEVPAAQVSSCTFGGSDLDVLFITTAEKEFPFGGKPDQPHAGGLFACRPGIRSRPAHRFAG